MAIKTPIEWCDSTCNGQAGCDGCELWAPGSRHCYAGVMTEMRAGKNPGWPLAFDKPQIFPGRIEKACVWPDLAGTERPAKPWMNGFPRLIFLDDMGDTFTESLPHDWLLQPFTMCPKGHMAPQVQHLKPEGVSVCSDRRCFQQWRTMSLLEAMERSPHVWIFLTKRAHRMRRLFTEFGRVPPHIWLGVSVTGPENLKRVDELLAIPGDCLRWVSFEPALRRARFPVDRLSWLVVGGESGGHGGDMPRDFDIATVDDVLEQTQGSRCRPFVKQMGSRPYQEGAGRVLLKDSKGGDMGEWLERHRVRQMPEWTPALRPSQPETVPPESLQPPQSPVPQEAMAL